jgi:hypothetical protein
MCGVAGMIDTQNQTAWELRGVGLLVLQSQHAHGS